MLRTAIIVQKRLIEPLWDVIRGMCASFAETALRHEDPRSRDLRVERGRNAPRGSVTPSTTLCERSRNTIHIARSGQLRRRLNADGQCALHRRGRHAQSTTDLYRARRSLPSLLFGGGHPVDLSEEIKRIGGYLLQYFLRDIDGGLLTNIPPKLKVKIHPVDQKW